MRYAVYGNLNGKESNLFINERTFKTKKYAAKVMMESQQYVDVVLYIKELPETITDTDRLNFLTEEKIAVLNAQGKYWIFKTKNCWHSMDLFDTPREAIDNAMKESKK